MNRGANGRTDRALSQLAAVLYEIAVDYGLDDPGPQRTIGCESEDEGSDREKVLTPQTGERELQVVVRALVKPPQLSGRPQKG